MYKYEDLKPTVFTEEGQERFLKIRDHVHATLEKSGAITMLKAMIGTGDSWARIACVDRLVELGEIREIPQTDCAGQDRIFVKR